MSLMLHDATLERGGTQVADIALVDITGLDEFIEGIEIRARRRTIFEEGLLSAVREDAVVRLQAQVGTCDGLEQTHAMHVMVEITPRAGVIEIREVVLALMAKRRMPEVMTHGDGLYEIEIEPERHADGTADAANHLQVEGASRDIVVTHERKDLRFICATRIERVVNDLLDVYHEARAPKIDVRILITLVELAYALVVTARIRREHGLNCGVTRTQLCLLVLGKFK